MVDIVDGGSDVPVARPAPGVIPVAGPWITEREVAAVAAAARSSWFENATTESSAFEQEFAAATKRAHAISLPSCTSGLHLALLALGVGSGDEVVVPETTWIATAAPVVYVGATPVFADVERDTWCLSVDSVRSVLTPRTKAIIPVDVYGGFPDMLALEALAAEHDLSIIEDAAEAVGGRHAGRIAGSFGHVSAFSFHGSKTLTTGEGGMIVCDDDALNGRMLFLRDHGRTPGDVTFRSTEVGWKYKMGEMQAAIGRVQLARLDELIARKRQIFGWYADRLKGSGIGLNVERPGDLATYWMVTAVLPDAANRTPEEIRDALATRAMATRPFFPPLSSLPAFTNSPDSARARRSNHVSYELARRSINLPSALTLSERDVDDVCELIRRITT